MKSKSLVQNTYSRNAFLTLTVAMIIGALSVIAYGFQAATYSEFFSIFGVGLLVAGASLFTGGILGFLFGIPRTLQRELPSNSEHSGIEASIDYMANTNLEQISDWLSKMLVGVGLTQLTAIPAYLNIITKQIAAALGQQSSGSVFALALILYFSVIGFLFGYLWTRLYLAGAFRQADLRTIGALASRVEQTNRKIEEFKKQSEQDVEALNLCYRQLNPGSEMPEVSEERLTAAVVSASRPIKIQIFNQAWVIRGDNWHDNKPLMERTIPIFRALIKSDTEGRYHMNHGQLGFALKDKQQPDYIEAERELSIAIQIRGPWQEQGWLYYEFNRAICRIMLDEAFGRDKPSEPSRLDAIIEDLRAAWHSVDLKQLIKQDALISRWLKTNKIKHSDLN